MSTPQHFISTSVTARVDITAGNRGYRAYHGLPHGNRAYSRGTITLAPAVWGTLVAALWSLELDCR
uniref:Uncharacterized protein n=1 Tax=Oryza sativa subsp. japonica TaxID=39947 RepID=Q2QQE1_ORYSJ|nr:hypothetical protein LOC_Os12g31360 [Oryza sativa Japonica Group]